MDQVCSDKLFSFKYSRQEAQLSQRDRVAACLNFGKNISAKKRASKSALCYVVDVDGSSFYCSTAVGTMFVLNAKLSSI